MVFYIKLNKPLDLHFEVASTRDGGGIGASDEPLSMHGLVTTDTPHWQRIVLDLQDTIEGNVHTYEEFKRFALRSRGYASDFIIDEIYIQYPAEPTQVSGVKEKGASVPTSSSLKQNYPNPFNPLTQIEFSLIKSGYTTLSVYNIHGQKVADLVNAQMSAGEHQVAFDASALPSGTYFYKLQSGDVSQVKKMLLIK